MSRILVVGGVGLAPLVESLRPRGHQVFETKVRSRAVGAVRDLVPDVVLLEASDPPSLDRSIFAELESDPLTRLIPVLHVLGNGGGVAESLRLGAHDAVNTATSGEEIEARIEAALRLKGALDALVADRQRSALLELAGAVAHRLNQPLTSLSVSVELLQADLQKGEIAHEALAAKLEEMIGLIEKMSGIIKRVQEIVEYRTTSYVGTVRIVDLEASGPDKP